ncbi:glycosyltransferase family 4 protein [Acidiferrimicrobium sp. IK]|uniref:glycosyltransferase family 4 protein n=1 Tax=Acidiferrimicrobium sp. IK TaxID=2871700 RepID=UPI0021CB52E5|nr:glycosyltransferase family 1 protein [Acidiferrimicrobium sp. IK]MCU4183775.1 glycosyltransferase family 4 protein [Acidiferrimicrobium sp. IK]
MRVLVDAGPLFGPQSGVGSFTSGLLGALARMPDIEAAVYATTIRGRRALEASLPPSVRLRNLPIPGRLVTQAWRHLDRPPIEWIAGSCDIVHGTNYVVPPAKAPRVMTVHDLSPVRYPEMTDAIVRTYPERIRHALRSGAYIHTHSAFVAEEIVEYFGVERHRLAVVASGVPALAAEAGPAVVEQVRAKGSFVLAIGTIEPRKDYPSLLRAFEEVASQRRDTRLVIVGRSAQGSEVFAEAVARSPFRDRVDLLGYASSELAGELLRRARVLAYPSLYEGFGYPPLQAMSAGVPVVTTDAGAIPGTVGDAASVVPVGDAGAMAAAIDRLLADDAARDALIERGRAKVGEYSWERCAREMTDWYRQIEAGRR